jgi:hypothetical protein
MRRINDRASAISSNAIRAFNLSGHGYFAMLVADQTCNELLAGLPREFSSVAELERPR